MTNPIARPTFYEGEILPAADLGATVDYARNQMARQSRYLHTWGIATGLVLKDPATLTAGIAIDGTGREIVVPDDVQLDPSTFDVFIQADGTYYPVYLNGVDQAAAPASSLTGACGGSQPTSMQETYSITFGAPGSELQVATQTPPAITDGPDGGNSSVWLVLVGFVTWDRTNSVFQSAVTNNPVTNIGPQYVGVNAAQVVSGSGSLLLATHPATPQGSGPVMAVQIQEASNGQMVFGKLGTDGTVTPALTVKANGDLIATGLISGASIPVKVQAQSGVACDGMVLPLPLGIDPSNSTIHVQVSMRYDLALLPIGSTVIALPLECTVDPSTRRVSSRLQLWDTSNWANGPVITPAACDYLVIVTASNGSGS
jgi:hypothetical protein